MTFSARLKEEIVSKSINDLSMIYELSAIIRYDATISNNHIQMTFENASIARRVFKDIKNLFNISPHIIVRNQKRLRARQIYILEIFDKVDEILKKLYIKKNGKFIDMNQDFLSSQEEILSYVIGTFLVTGSINDPKTGGYHMEFVFSKKEDADFMNEIFHVMNFDSKITKRNSRYLVYLKNSEEISDMIRMFDAPNALFYFEDIRIYRDHKNMVNRLNNCEIANQEKSTRTGIKQLEDINYLKEYDLIPLLDEKTQIVLEYREKYPESSYQELADIITLESGYKLGKSGINHHFIKMKKLVCQHKDNSL